MISYWNENRYSQLKNFSFWKGEKLNSSKFKALIAALAATQLRVLGKFKSFGNCLLTVRRAPSGTTTANTDKKSNLVTTHDSNGDGKLEELDQK